MYNPKNKEFSRILFPIDGSESSIKVAEYTIGIARKKAENNNTELIALHVIHSEIKHAYSTYYGGSVNQSSIEGIIEHAKREAQTWFDKVQEICDENNVKLRREIIVNPRSLVGAIIDYAEHHIPLHTILLFQSSHYRFCSSLRRSVYNFSFISSLWRLSRLYHASRII